ncbi:MAG TPA: ABC transporter permease [Thermoanaerobaculia bacterium]|nr:ABC transporter permease [Thermoanaerobaculia bacterium]
MSLGFWRRKRREQDLEQEIQSHLQMAVRERIERGESAEEARHAAHRELGNVGLIKEATREAWGWTWWERLVQDLGYGARLLRKNRAFSLVAILTLALGIGAATAIFSVVYGVLLRPLPYARPERIVRLWEVSAQGHQMSFADPNFADIHAQSHSLRGLAEYASWVQSVSGGSEPTRTPVATVSRDFFLVMGIEPVLGRGFAVEDQRFGAAPVALVSDAFWRRYLGSSTDLTRTRLTIENHATAVVGVLPRGFSFPEDAEIWTPRELEAPYPSRTAHNWRVVGRLRDGIALSQARAEIAGIAQQLKRQYGKDIEMADAAVVPLREALTGDVRGALLILLGGVGFLLLIACANVVNLLLAQLTVREGELAIRAALGAGRRRLIRQFLTESLLLSLSGGALGVLAAVWGVEALVAKAPRDLPRLGEVAVSLPVLFFALGLTVAVAAGLGILTARRATSGELQGALVEGGRAQAGTVRGQRLGRVIVAAQLAMTLVLLVGAGLLGRSLLSVLAVDPGFRTEQVATMNLALPGVDSEADGHRRVRFLDELFARLRGIPGVGEVGGSAALPLVEAPPNGTFLLLNPGEVLPRMKDLERLFHDSTRTGDADFCVASAGYFPTLGIPLLRGRLFDDRDTMEAPHAAVISQALAREKWPNQDPLGRAIEFGNMDGDLRVLTVVGVVGDIRAKSLEALPRPTVYVNYRQRPRKTWSFDVVMRAKADPAAVLAAARSIVRNLDPTVPPSLNTFRQVFARSLQTRRFHLILLGSFAGTALLLALIGIYGVMGYAVERRTREVGVRMALGARAGDVLRLILGQGVLAAAVGVALGVGGAVVLTRTMQSLLFGVSATDPVTFAAVALLLAAVALLASYIPARRATRVDPLVALRSE